VLFVAQNYRVRPANITQTGQCTGCSAGRTPDGSGSCSGV
jgi:hypothetical protein